MESFKCCLLSIKSLHCASKITDQIVEPRCCCVELQCYEKPLYVLSLIRGGSRDFGKGGVDQKVGFNRNEEAIKNALKWRKPDISSFISKKVVICVKKSYLSLK